MQKDDGLVAFWGDGVIAGVQWAWHQFFFPIIFQENSFWDTWGYRDMGHVFISVRPVMFTVDMAIEACAGLPVLDALSVGGVGDCFLGPQARMLGRWQVREDLVFFCFWSYFSSIFWLNDFLREGKRMEKPKIMYAIYGHLPADETMPRVFCEFVRSRLGRTIRNLMLKKYGYLLWKSNAYHQAELWSFYLRSIHRSAQGKDFQDAWVPTIALRWISSGFWSPCSHFTHSYIMFSWSLSDSQWWFLFASWVLRLTDIVACSFFIFPWGFANRHGGFDEVLLGPVARYIRQWSSKGVTQGDATAKMSKHLQATSVCIQ